jgi:hypothetical protein
VPFESSATLLRTSNNKLEAGGLLSRMEMDKEGAELSTKLAMWARLAERVSQAFLMFVAEMVE